MSRKPQAKTRNTSPRTASAGDPPRVGLALSRALLAELRDDPEAVGVKAFARQVAADAEPDELAELGAAGLARNLAEVWRFAGRRRGRSPQVRIAPALDAELDRLEIVQDDAPFLVDSVMGEIADQGLNVRAMFHPIVEVARDRAGYRARAGRRAAVDDRRDARADRRRPRGRADRGIKDTLADVRAAVDDFPPCWI